MREPDFNNLLKVLGRKKPSRPTLFEFSLNDTLHTRLSGMAPGQGKGYERVVKAFHKAGYDYAKAGTGGFEGFPKGERAHERTVSLNEGFVISDRRSFEEYLWPDVNRCDYSELERAKEYLPDGMKLIVGGPGGVLENIIGLLGYDNLCFLLADDPELFKEVCDNVGSRLVRHYERLGQYATVGAMISNDDWGFKTQPMISPSDMRRYIIPWHKRIVSAIHSSGRPAILHSCGNLMSLTDDIVGIGYDGKHSYEDIIEPVEEAYERLHGRIAVLGGMDLDFLCRENPANIRRRASAMLERSGKDGAYALGSGNSIPEYVPQENYFAMISAAGISV